MGDPALAVPTRLGRYQVLKHLATGGMAEVLLARTQSPDGAIHHVVLKRIRGEQARDERFVRMFLDEASLAALLQHPNIVRVYEIGEEAGEYFFSMEYVHGEDLRKVLLEVNRQHDKVPLAHVLNITSAVALGLHYAHEALSPDGRPLGLVHRDVSPANILIGYDGSVKVADFGIAKATLHSAETRSGTLKGKVSYMSPEQVTGRAIDRKSDVFALGIVLYEIVTSKRLFKGDNDFLTMSAIVQGEVPAPTQIRGDVPKPLEDIIMKALAVDPEHRYATADELRLALERFMNATGLRTTNAGVADYMKKLFGQRQPPWLVDTSPTHAVDWDESGAGVVAPPMAAVERHALPRRIGPTSPIVIAHNFATGQSYTPPPLERNLRAQTEAVPAIGFARPTGFSDGPPQRARSPWLVRGAVVTCAIAIAGGIVFAMNQSNSSSAAPIDDRAAAEPAAAKPEVAPTPPEPKPDEPAAKPADEPPPQQAAEEPKPEPPVDKRTAAQRRADEKREAIEQAKRDALAKKAAAEQAKRDAAAAKLAEVQAKREAAEQAKRKREAEALAKHEAAEQASREAAAKKAEAAAKRAELAKKRPPVKKRPATKPDTKPDNSKPGWDPDSLFPK